MRNTFRRLVLHPEERVDLKATPSDGNGKRVLVFYFPQFHEFDVNNRLWGKGYTDFIGVEAARRARWGYPVIRPLDGFYNLLEYTTRHRQARIARAFDVGGFVYYHYWFSGGPVMEAPLEAMLIDDEPDIPFAIAWANEHWTRRWDGGNNDILMEQQYDRSDWRPHFDWLLRFFNHRNYILRDNQPVIVFYRIAEIEGFAEMLAAWREWAVAAGFDGLHVVQMNGVAWTPPPDCFRKQPQADAALEFYPNFYGGGVKPLAGLLATGPEAFGFSRDTYYFGVHASFNNKPRHLNDGHDTILPYHPVNLRAALRQQLSRTPNGSFVFLNAWNEWGEGAAIEPSIEFGYAWLEAIRDAVADDAAGARTPNLPPVGVPTTVMQGGGGEGGAGGNARIARGDGSGGSRVCLIVRTYKGHSDGELYSLRRTLHTLLNLQHTDWEAFVLDTGAVPFETMDRIVEDLQDSRITALVTPRQFRKPYESYTSGYDATDWAVEEKCVRSNRFDWLLVTNGDNFYAPDALNHLPDSTDMVLMNFHGRYSLVNSLAFTKAGLDHCCSRLRNYRCQPSSPKIGFVDLGAMLIHVPAWSADRLSFSQFTGACGALSCHDGAFAEYVDTALHWRIVYHPPEACALMHNPNPVSCALVGGLYYDTDDWRQARCFEPNAFPMALGSVDWVKFVADDGCVCERHHE